MPLPEKSILENTDTVEQQRNPPFMQEPLNSPGPTNSPGQGANNTPIPIPELGTGQVNYRQSNDSPFSEEFLNKVYNVPKRGTTPSNLPSFSEREVNQPRYPQFMPGADNEEVYGLNQGFFSKVGHGLAKTVALAAGTFAQGMMTIPDTISALANHDTSKLYDSDVERAADKWRTNLENFLPNYETAAQRNMNPFLQAIPFSGNATNFWFDKVLPNVGFVAGAIGAAVAQDAAVGAVTGGAGDIPLSASQFGKASLWLNKLFLTADKAEDLLKAGKVASQLIEKGVDLSRDELITLKGLQTLATAKKIGSGANYMMNLYSGARTMSAGGAREMHDSIRSELIANYTNKNGYGPIGDDLKKIEDTATGAANAKFAVDTALMMVAESISFDNILKPAGAARDKYIATAQRNLGKDLSNVKFVPGTIDKLEYVEPEGWGKAWAAIRPTIPHILNAGPIMGGGMYATNAAVHSFYEDKYNGKIAGTIEDAVNATLKGLQDEFFTKEGIESVLVGSILGAFIGPIQKKLEYRARGTTPSAERDAVIDLLNSHSLSGFMKTNFDSAAKNLSLADQMREAIEKDDVFAYKNLQHQAFVDFVLSHINNGMYDVAIEKLRMMKELPDAEFKKLFGIDVKDKKTANEYVEKLIQQAEAIKKSHDLISDTFKNPFVRRDKPRSQEEIEANLKHDFFEEWKGNLADYASIKNNVRDRAASIQSDIHTISQYVSNQQIMQLSHPEKLAEYNRNLKARAKDLQDSLKTEASVNRKEDRETLNYLNKLTESVDKLIQRHKSKGEERETPNVYYNNKDLDILKDLLDYQINGGDISKRIEVPEEGLPKLATYGGDLNKLDVLKEQASKAYSILATEKGFNDFYNAERRREATAQPEPTEKPTGTKALPEPDKITLINPYTNKAKTLNKGQMVNLYRKEKGNPERVEVVAKNDDGTLSIKNAEGDIEVLKPEDLFKPSKWATESDEVIGEGSNEDQPPPPIEALPASEGPGFDPRPDIVSGIISTSSPRYEIPNLEDNNFHQREQQFLYNFSSTDPNKFNQESIPSLKLQPVTEKIQERMGFPKDWIKDKEAIRGVYIIRTPEGDFYVDKKGDKISKVGEKIDPKEAIYSNFRDTNLVNAEGQAKYTNKGNLDEATIVKWWGDQREFLLNAENPAPYDFTVSRGFYPHDKRGPDGKKSRNSVKDTKFIRDEDLSKPLINISTGANITPEGVFDEAGKGIGATKEGTLMGKGGQSVFNYRGNMFFLENRRFSENEASNIFSLLKHYSNREIPEDERKEVGDYLKSLLYIIGNKSKKAPTKNSLSIKGDELYLGQKAESIDMSPEALEENKTEILNFLQGVFHNISNEKLNDIRNSPKDAEKLKFKELTVTDGKVAVKREWENYNHYLLSSEGGRDSILATDISIPQGDAPPVLNKYSTLKGFEVPNTPREVKVEEKPIEVKKAETKEVEPKQVLLKTGKGEYHLIYIPELDAEGREIGVKGIIGKRPAGGGEIEDVKNIQAAKELLLKGIQANLLKKDDSTSSTTDQGLGDPNITASPGAQTSFVEVLPNNYEKEDIEAQFAEARRVLGEDTHLVRLKNILKLTGGGFAYGAFEKDVISVWEGAKKGTVGHEVFEKVYNVFLDGREQEGLHKEFTSREGDFTNYLGESKKFSEANVKEAKERIADEFGEYMTTGKLPEYTKQRTFFQRLVDFIKKIIFGDPSKINQLFKSINAEHYKDFPTRYSHEGPEYARGIEASEAFVSDALAGMTSKLFTDVFGEDKSIVTKLEEKPKEASREIMDRLYNKMQDYYESKNPDSLYAMYNDKYKAATSEGEKAEYNAQLRELRGGWDTIKANWGAYAREFKKSLKPFGMEFKIDDEGYIKFSEEVLNEDDKNPNEYDRDIFTVDARNNASTRVKLLYATIADSTWVKDAAKQAFDKITAKIDNSLVGMPKLAPYAQLFNYVLNNVVGTPGLDAMMRKIASIANDVSKLKNANVRRLYNRLDKKGVFQDEGFKGKSLDEVKLLLSFEKTHAKQRPGFFRVSIDEKGDAHFQTNVNSGKVYEVKQNWVANMKESPYVKSNPNGTLSFKESIGKNESNQEFLHKLGVDISRAEYESLDDSVKKSLNDNVNAIRKVVEDAAKNKIELPILSGESADFDTRLEKIAEVYITHIVGDDAQSQHLNLEDQPTSNFVLNNVLSTVLNDAASSNTKEEFLAKNPYLNDIYHKDSLLVNEKMFNAEGKRNRPVKIGVSEGRRHQGTGSSAPTYNMTKAERGLHELNNNIMGVFYTLVPADSKTEWAIDSGTYIEASKWFSSTSRDNAVSAFASQMYKYLENEVELARDYGNRRDIVALNDKLGDRVKGNSLRFFKDLLPKEVVERIHNEVIDAGKPLEEVYTVPEMRAAMRQWILDRAEEGFKDLVESQFFQNHYGREDEYKLNGVIKEFLDEHLGGKEAYSKNDALRLLAYREANYMISNIELHKLMLGDPAQFSDEIKRVKSFLGGIEWSHIDERGDEGGFNQAVGEKLNMAHESISLNPEDIGYTTFKNHANTFTVHDVMVQSRNFEELKSILDGEGVPKEEAVDITDKLKAIEERRAEEIIKATRPPKLQFIPNKEIIKSEEAAKIKIEQERIRDEEAKLMQLMKCL